LSKTSGGSIKGSTSFSFLGITGGKDLLLLSSWTLEETGDKGSGDSLALGTDGSFGNWKLI